MKKRVKQVIAALLATVLVFNVAGCAKSTEADNDVKNFSVTAEKSTVKNPVKEQPNKEAAPQAVQLNHDAAAQTEEQEITLTAPTEYDRESMEQIVQTFGDDSLSEEDVTQMEEEELNQLAEEILQSMENQKPSNDSEEKQDEEDENFDENGAMKKPFDQIYPELIEEEKVAYDDETILLKMSNAKKSEISEAMKAAGVAALEEIVPMENSTWYEAKLFEGTDAKETVNILRELSEIQMVDYNYEVEVNGMADAQAIPRELRDNPKADEQWHLEYCGYPYASAVMENPGGSSNVVVAVIDSGVDYDHEDLAQNIWVNSAEVPDNGKDDDKNGYIDDYYGVNIVAGKGNGDDDNGHGTHVAGIIAAQNNNLGVAGMAYNAKIMSIKAAMSNGSLLQSDIAKAVLYAYENGAEIINMSFGGSACSIAVQDALEAAYSRCVLVASAGNDTYINEDAKRTQCDVVPNYPAALNYVLGVMSVNESGVESGFTNIDGALYTKQEYEVYAPGEGIMSTIPNNQYASWSGTSMAAPVVSALAAILRSEYTDRDTYPTKFIYGQITATSEDSAVCCNPDLHGEHNIPNIVNFWDALTKLPTPDVGLNDYALFDTEGLAEDTLGKNNGDGVIDAGETIALGLTLRNRWGQAEDTMVSIDTLTHGGMTDPYIEIINPEVNYGTVGTYSTANCGAIYTDDMLSGWENPFYIKIAEDCPNDYIFTLNVHISASNGLDKKDNNQYTNDGTVTLTVRSGTILPSVIEEDMTLTADSLYIIPNSTTILEGVTVKVEPGTHIQFWSNDPSDPYADQYIAGLDVKGQFLVNGTVENPVYIYPSELMSEYIVDIFESENGYVSLKYADVTNYATSKSISLVENCIFRQNYTDSLRYRYFQYGQMNSNWKNNLGSIDKANNCAFYKIGGCDHLSNISDLTGTYQNCIFVNCALRYSNTSYFCDCVFLGSLNTSNLDYGIKKRSSYITKYHFDYNWFFEEAHSDIYYNSNSGTTYLLLDAIRNTLDYKYVDELMLYVLSRLGGNYAAIETEEEKQWIDNNIGKQWRIQTIYDEVNDCYLWANGNKIEEFVGSSDIIRHDNYIIYDKTIKTTTNSMENILYEIPGEIYPEDIKLDSYEVNIDTGSTYQIVPTAIPATDHFIFESADESVVTVSDTGLITPVSEGITDVYVYSFDKAVFNYITVNVKEYVPLESIAFTNTEIVLEPGETYQAKCTFNPMDTTRKNVSYQSTDTKVAVVDEKGVITAVGRGTATITASAEGLSSELKVSVIEKATEVNIVKSVLTASLSSGSIELPEVALTNGADAVLEWKSTDPKVAEIIEGRLELIGEGTTSVIVTDTMSGLSDSVLLYVAENIPIIKKIVGYKDTGYSLDENGNVYSCEYTVEGGNAEPFAEDVKDIEMSGTYAIFLMEDGTIYTNRTSDKRLIFVTDYFVGKNPIQVEIYNDNYFVLTSEGYVYSWGKNNYGILGLGHKDVVNEPTLVNLEDVIEIKVHHNEGISTFLQSSGKLYKAGGKNQGIVVPTLESDNVSHLLKDSAFLFYASEKKLRNLIDHKGNTYSYLIEDFEIIAGYSDSNGNLAVKDGELYRLGSNDYTKIETDAKISVIRALDSTPSKYGIASTDGMLYVYDGKKFSKINTFIYDNDSVKVNSSNILDGKTLLEEKLVLEFNKEIQSYDFAFYADEQQIPVTVDMKRNVMTISRSAGFQKGVNYRLEIQPEGLSGLAGTTNVEQISLNFTSEYEAPEVPEAPEIIIRESQRDESLERLYWTPETLVEKMKELYETEQMNPQFYGNVILNRTTTDTDPEHWLRVVAPTSSSYQEIMLGGNYWGTTNETLIGKQIVDFSDYNTYTRLKYENYLTEAPEDTFPFVTDVTILNKEGEKVSTVGSEEITVKVSFNRDMDTFIPLRVTFGSSYPYADYVIEGEYIDARTWQGVYTLSTLIEGGSNYFTIGNGCSAEENLQLFEDVARFGFDIDNTSAQALLMQGYATDTGIQLSWTQDDFETLMGYNVYRSTSEDGFYQKLNATIIPTETKEFFDDTVEPGTTYYYNFTVVQTDMQESIPSGKITLMSKDTMEPDIYHTPVYTAYTGSNLMITATVTDNLNVSAVKTYYRVAGTEDWNVIMMSKLNDKYSAIITADAVTTDGLEYYIEAYDGINYNYKGSDEAPYFVTVQESIDKDSLGDVNGDGKISNLDALMLLQAINDKLNLTSEQFIRADLDGNGVLQAFEALRILQYVNGTVGSVKMS